MKQRLLYASKSKIQLVFADSTEVLLRTTLTNSRKRALPIRDEMHLNRRHACPIVSQTKFYYFIYTIQTLRSTIDSSDKQMSKPTVFERLCVF